MKFFWPKETEHWKATIDSIVSQPPLNPFHSDVFSFLQDFSKKVLRDHSFRNFPELISLAYWLRKAHLVELQNQFLERTKERVIFARGTALHFAPSNVDTIFVYSWVLSMLAGNNNILRISSRKLGQSELLISTILSILEKYPQVANRTAIITYDHNDETTQYLSERCHVRVIWGGDTTVKAIRSIPLSPLAAEIAFPDRFSLSAIEADAVLNSPDSTFEDFVHQFYNDGFWFGQMACSSPRLLAWVGEKSQIEDAQQRFWNRVDEYVNSQQIELSAAMQVQKLTTGYFLSVKENVESFRQLQNFSRLKVNKMDVEMRERHCGGGLFIELELSELEELIPYLEDKDQTLSYFGFSQERLKEFTLHLKNRSIDRIVPIGQALNFEGVWDGYDLLMHFTREIVIR